MRTLIACAFLAGLSACATTQTSGTYGNLVQDAVPANDRKMADDVVKKLTALYPPARTRLNLRHGTPDAFGTALVESLRARGYALAEFRSRAQVGPASAASTAGEATAGGRTLAYVVDQPLGEELFRVTVMIDSQSLSRVYRMKDGAISPAGYWARKE